MSDGWEEYEAPGRLAQEVLDSLADQGPFSPEVRTEADQAFGELGGFCGEQCFENAVFSREVRVGQFELGLRMKDEHRPHWKSCMTMFQRLAYERLHPADQLRVAAADDPLGELDKEIWRSHEDQG